MSRLFYRFVFFALLVYCNTANSQGLSKDSALFESAFSVFREPSYISVLGGVGNIEPLLFEADIVPYFMLSLNENNKWGIELSPRFVLRMYNQESFPVRTPSFMPRATFFYKISKKNIHGKTAFTYFSWCHHSNGQDGSFLNSDSTAINTLSGNFSTNMIEGGVFISHPDRRFPKAAINYVKLSAVYHYYQARELRALYGRVRMFSDFQSTLNLSKLLKIFGNTSDNPTIHNVLLSQSIRIGYIAGNMGDVDAFDSKRLVFRYTVAFKPSFLNDVTLFAQYYYGQDYYNIYFFRTLKVLRFGLAAKTSIFE